jgi:hypothetical protein
MRYLALPVSLVGVGTEAFGESGVAWSLAGIVERPTAGDGRCL